MQEVNREMQEELAKTFARMRSEINSRERIDLERALQPFAGEVALLNDGKLVEKLTTILELVTKTAQIEGVQVYERKSEFFELASADVELPLTGIAQSRSELIRSSRPWSKSWIGLRARLEKFDRKAKELPSAIAVVGYGLGVAVSAIYGGVFFIEISMLLGILAICGVLGGGLWVPYRISEDTIIISDISNISVPGTDILRQKLLASGFESRGEIKGHALNRLRITIQTRYTPEAQSKLKLK